MDQITVTWPGPNQADPSGAAAANPAVNRCCEAWLRVYKEERQRGRTKVASSYMAADAYRNAMPALSEQRNISDFVACTAYGILIGAIEKQQSGRLLYAAQVALSIARTFPAPANAGSCPPPSPYI